MCLHVWDDVAFATTEEFGLAVVEDLDFNVFMKLPDGCGDRSGKVVKLNKSVYGLKQAGRRWAMHLGDVIARNVGMEQCKADRSLRFPAD